MGIGGSNGREGSAFTRIYVHVCCVQREVIVAGLDTPCTVHVTCVPVSVFCANNWLNS